MIKLTFQAKVWLKIAEHVPVGEPDGLNAQLKAQLPQLVAQDQPGDYVELELDAAEALVVRQVTRRYGTELWQFTATPTDQPTPGRGAPRSFASPSKPGGGDLL